MLYLKTNEMVVSNPNMINSESLHPINNLDRSFKHLIIGKCGSAPFN